MKNSNYKNQYKLGIIAALITAVGTLFSGPLAFLAVSSIKPQPAWASPQVFVENFHPIQSVTFYFGFLLITGSILMVAFIHHQLKDEKTLLAVIFTAIAGGLIFFNYFTEATFVPALVKKIQTRTGSNHQSFCSNQSSIFILGYRDVGLWIFRDGIDFRCSLF